MNQHLLAILVALPLLAAILIGCVPRRLVPIVRPFALLATLVELALSAKLLFAHYDRARPAFAEHYGWVWDSGLSVALEVDGLSMPLVLLATAITPIALLASFPEKRSRAKTWAAGVLVMEAALVGAFLARDLVFFYVCWELVLLPLYVFVAVWSGRSVTANKFFLYTLAGSMLMLVAILYLGGAYAAESARPSFLLSDLQRVVLPLPQQTLCFAALAIAFAIKMPLFPLHSWSPDTYRDAPLGAAILASAVMAKLGSYGLMRFAMTLFPLGSQYVGPTIAVLAVVGILYGALAATKQDDVRVMLAYSSMSHMGFVVLGLFAMTPIGLAGSVLQMVSHGITIAGLFLVIGAVEARTGTRAISELSGLATPTPRLATAFVLIGLAAVAVPTTSGFVGETMILSGAFASSQMVGLGAYGRFFAVTAGLGVIFGAIYVLSLLQKVVWGEPNEKTRGLAEGPGDLTLGESLRIVPLVLAAFVLGLAPRLLLDAVQPAAASAMLSFDMRWAGSHDVEVATVLAPSDAEEDDDALPPDLDRNVEEGPPPSPIPRHVPDVHGGTP